MEAFFGECFKSRCNQIVGSMMSSSLYMPGETEKVAHIPKRRSIVFFLISSVDMFFSLTSTKHPLTVSDLKKKLQIDCYQPLISNQRC